MVLYSRCQVEIKQIPQFQAVFEKYYANLTAIALLNES